MTTPAGDSKLYSRALTDLLRLHGSSELALGQKFQFGSNATQFLQDYCFNANKKCVLKYGSGKSNTYVCDSVKCPWEVRVTRRVGHDGSHHMYVLTLRNRHHNFCTSIAKPTQRQIQALSTIQAAARGDRGMKRKALMSLVQVRDYTNLQEYRLKLCRAKDSIVDMPNGAWVESFSYIPALLLELRDKNPGATIRLKVDQHRRFLRGFVAF
uniref:Transposase MuDR plant domain-containing protein n=1 Tax=Globisporangium ultimum (strain ATCC 200006 / CBS 805.95 / DAOM BR144) TaxID=431595 RepID=K3WRD5_GLOUD